MALEDELEFGPVERGLSLKEAQLRVPPGWAGLVEECFQIIGDHNWKTQIPQGLPLIVITSAEAIDGRLILGIFQGEDEMPELAKLIAARSMFICEMCAKRGECKRIVDIWLPIQCDPRTLCEDCWRKEEEITRDLCTAITSDSIKPAYELDPLDDRPWYPGKDEEDDARDGEESDLPF